MKTKLFTRNAFLGIRMSLVLAFGVLGTADALTMDLTGNPDDLSTIVDEGTATLTLTATANIDNTRESVRLSISG